MEPKNINTYEIFFEGYTIIVQAENIEKALQMTPVANPVLAIMDIKFRDAEYSKNAEASLIKTIKRFEESSDIPEETDYDYIQKEVVLAAMEEYAAQFREGE